MSIKEDIIQRGKDSITFSVFDVAPAPEALPEEPLQSALQKLMSDHRPLLACFAAQQKVVTEVYFHPLIAAAHLAFSQHRPLSLSPDMIWLTITQGFAQHVNLHAEKLRERLVTHQGKLQLTVVRDDFDKNSPFEFWPEVISSFGESIKDHIGGELYQTLLADFSTTSPTEKIASEIVMMDAFRAYFDYIVLCICGIPQITLEGSPGDWTRLKQKVSRLERYDLQWWTKHLLPICEQFIRASEGDIDQAHWRDIYKLEKAYGAEVLNGWIVKLIPYLGGGERVNPLLKNEATESTHIYSSSLPFGLSVVSLLMKNRATQKTTPLEAIGGFVGVTQDPKTKTLRPKIGWAVREANQLAASIEKLKEQNLLRSIPERHVRSWSSWALESVGMPSDLYEFFNVTDGVTLSARGKVVYQISSLDALDFPRYRVDTPTSISDFRASLLSPEELEEEVNHEKIRSWVKLCALPDGSCYAYTGKQSSEHFSNAMLYAGRRPTHEWVFVHTDAEKTKKRTGRIVARSFSALLSQMLDSPEVPFHARPGFSFLGEISMK